MTSLAAIQSLAARRQRNWGAHPKTDPALSDELTRKLDDAFAQRRMELARSQHGSTADIVRRARVEREIERLASGNGE